MLTSLWATISIGVAVFASTNVDDIVLLSMFFADSSLRARSVVLGQFVGIGAIVVVSVAAGFAAVAVPQQWIALLGIAPLALGLWKLIALVRRRSGDGEQTDPPVEHGARSQWLAVAAVTLANGGDNLGVYIPLFAKSPAAIPVYVILFALLTGLWCVLGHALVKNRVVGAHVSRYGHVVLPFVLLGLGLYILSGALD